MSIEIPELGSLDDKLTLKEWVPDNAVTVVVPGSGSIVKTIFSSFSTGGGVGGLGVGVLDLPHEESNTPATIKSIKDFRIFLSILFKIKIFQCKNMSNLIHV
jgi:hypothetical protein